LLRLGRREAFIDPRILLGCVSAVAVVLGFSGRWIRDRAAPAIGSFGSLGLSLAIMFLVSYALWEKVWSIYRYLAIQEAVSGVLVLGALPILFGIRGRPWRMTGLFALVVVWTVRTTEYPWWDRAPRGPQALSVNCRPSNRTRWFSSSILRPTPTLCPRCRVPPVRSASIAILFNPAAQGSSGN
jgi:uncharacterized membrane protein